MKQKPKIGNFECVQQSTSSKHIISAMSIIGTYSFSDPAQADSLYYGLFYEFAKKKDRVVLLTLEDDTNPGQMDRLVRTVPLLVLDSRVTVFVGKSVPKIPIYVMHEDWFCNGSVIYRFGMTNIFRIRRKWSEVGYESNMSQLEDLRDCEFPFRDSSKYMSALAQSHDLYCFRSTLCDSFQRSFKRSTLFAKTLSFELPCISAALISALYSLPGIVSRVRKSGHGKVIVVVDNDKIYVQKPITYTYMAVGLRIQATFHE